MDAWRGFTNCVDCGTATMTGIPKLSIAVTFYYLEERLQYLSRVASQFHLLADEIEVHVFTHEADAYKHHRIMQSIGEHSSRKTTIHVPTLMGHPYLLTWSHLAVFRQRFQVDASITHFMYVEDDIYVTPRNIRFWLDGREKLKSVGVIPSFLRYEINDRDGELYSSDVMDRLELGKLPKVQLSENYCYVNLPQPYQGIYFLDRELMAEHLSGASSVPEYSPWGIREKAAAGITFMNVPKGCFSRNFIGYDLSAGKIDLDCMIHHLPNNYVNNPDINLGSIKISDLINNSSSAPQQALS